MRPVLIPAVLALLMILPPTAFAQEPAGYLVEDGSGDVSAGAAGARQPVPAVDTLPYIDVTRLEIRDLDEEIVEFRLSNEPGFKPAPSDISTQMYFGIQQPRHRVHFTVAGSGSAPLKVFLETDQLRLRVENNTNAKTEAVTTSVSLCVPLPGSTRCDFFSRYYLDFRIEDGVLVIPLPKEYLTSQAAESRSFFGSAGGATALPPRLFVGDKLTEIHVLAEEPNEVFAEGLGVPTLEIQDRMPDEGNAPDFTFQYPSATNDLIIHYPPWSVVAGEENVISIQVDNKAPVKRIVNFTLEQDPRAGDPWPMSVSPSATIPAGASTNITVRAKVPPLDDGVRDHAMVKIRANVVTQPGNVAIRTAYFSSTVPLDKEHDTFFFYGQTYQSPIPVLPSYGYGQLTRLDSEAAAETAAVPFNSYISFGGSGGELYLMQYAWDAGGIPNPATIRPGETGQAQLEIDSPAAFDGSISVQLIQADVTLAQHVGAISVQQGRTAIELPLTILPGVSRIVPENGTVYMVMEITGSGAQATAVNTIHFSGQEVSLMPEGTRFRLPLDRDVSSVSAAAPLQVSLAATEDLEAFINPGRTQVFEFDLRNEEAKPVRIELAVENKSADWPTEIRPGARYRLDGNDSAHLGVVVSAPPSVKEGFQFTFNVVARDSDSSLAVAAARVRLIVTSGVEVENETFDAASEDASKLDVEAGKSPTVPLVAAIAVVAVMAWRRRRSAQ